MNGRNQQLLSHLAFAVASHQKVLKKARLPIPEWLPFISDFLTDVATSRQDAPSLGEDVEFIDPEHMSPPPMLLKRNEVAAALGCSVRHVDRLIADGALPVVELGKSPRVRRSDLESYVAGLVHRTFRDDIDTKESA